VTWLTAAALLVATTPAAAGEQHVVDATVLHQAIADRAAADAANRQTVERLLSRPEVEVVAARMGLDIKDARTAVGTLTSQDLALVAGHASAVEADLAGGQRTIVISLTTLLLIIIIIILLVD
jgi:hypothetical protein